MGRIAVGAFVAVAIAMPVPASADGLVAGVASGGLGVLIILVLLGLYFIPALVASKREHMSAGAVFALNLFLGWTFLGWVLALVWALNSNTRANAERYLRRPSEI